MEEREWEERAEDRFFTAAEEGGRDRETDASAGLSGNVTGGEAGRSAWDVFAATGKVQDYLLYKSASEGRSF